MDRKVALNRSCHEISSVCRALNVGNESSSNSSTQDESVTGIFVAMELPSVRRKTRKAWHDRSSQRSQAHMATL